MPHTYANNHGEEEEKSFMSLPIELRSIIYRGAAASDEPLTFYPVERPGAGAAGREYQQLNDTNAVKRRIRYIQANPYSRFNRLKGFAKATGAMAQLQELMFIKRDKQEAMKAFYNSKVFRFDHSCGIITLELFLNTIGRGKASYIRHLQVRLPDFNNFVGYGNLIAACMELESTNTGLTPIRCPPRDRLLGALRNSLLVLSKPRPTGRGKRKPSEPSSASGQTKPVLHRLDLILRDTDIPSFILPEEAKLVLHKKQQKANYFKRFQEGKAIWSKFRKAMPETTITVVVESGEGSSFKLRPNVWEEIKSTASAFGWDCVRRTRPSSGEVQGSSSRDQL